LFTPPAPWQVQSEPSWGILCPSFLSSHGLPRADAYLPSISRWPFARRRLPGRVVAPAASVPMSRDIQAMAEPYHIPLSVRHWTCQVIGHRTGRLTTRSSLSTANGIVPQSAPPTDCFDLVTTPQALTPARGSSARVAEQPTAGNKSNNDWPTGPQTEADRARPGSLFQVLRQRGRQIAMATRFSTSTTASTATTSGNYGVTGHVVPMGTTQPIFERCVSGALAAGSVCVSNTSDACIALRVAELAVDLWFSTWIASTS
jgi:hypothetical protein